MREQLYSLACEISHVSNYKKSITLRVSLCRRHKVRHKNRCKCTKKSEMQDRFGVFFLFLRHNSFKTMSHTDILHQIQQLGRQVLPQDAHLLLYGSRARGDYHEDSDWDLLVLLNRPQEASDFQNIAYPIMELGFDLGEYFSVQTYSQQEWDSMSFLPYYKNVEQDKIVLV